MLGAGCAVMRNSPAPRSMLERTSRGSMPTQQRSIKATARDVTLVLNASAGTQWSRGCSEPRQIAAIFARGVWAVTAVPAQAGNVVLDCTTVQQVYAGIERGWRTGRAGAQSSRPIAAVAASPVPTFAAASQASLE